MSSLDSFELSPPAWVWPVPRPSLRRVGQSVLQDRDGKGRPHYGLDIFAPVGTPILSAQSGLVGRIVDVRLDWISTGATTVEQHWSFSTDGGVTWSTPDVLVMSK